MSAGEDNIFRSFFKGINRYSGFKAPVSFDSRSEHTRNCDNSSFLRLHGGGADPGVQFIHQGK